MRRSAQYKHSKIILWVHWQQQTAIFRYNCGIDSPIKLRRLWICCALHALIHRVGLRGITWTIRLEPISTCSHQMQGSYLWSSGILNIMANPRHWHAVPRPIDRPLPLQSLFCSRDTSISDIWICRVISTALPGTFYTLEWAFTRGNWWACHDVRCKKWNQIKERVLSPKSYIKLKQAAGIKTHKQLPPQPTIGCFPGHSMTPIRSSCTFRWIKGGWRQGGTKSGSSDDGNNGCPANYHSTESHSPKTVIKDSENTLTSYTPQHP